MLIEIISFHEIVIKNKDTHSVTDALISAQFTSKTTETHFKNVFPLSAMDESPTNIAGHLISPGKKHSTNDFGSIWKQNNYFFTSDSIVTLISFFSDKYQFVDVYITA